MNEKISETTIQKIKKEVSSRREADKQWYLSLLDEEAQLSYENHHLRAVLRLLKILYIDVEKEKIARAEEEIAAIRNGTDHSAEAYARTVDKNEQIALSRRAIESFRHFFEETYFARMDVKDDKEGYNAYYIGKKGDLELGIVDWRAPLSRRYYQKSQRSFTINEYNYEVVLRRAIQTRAGKIVRFKNEYLSVQGVLTKEEIAGRDEQIVLDPFLREILRERKDEESVRDIIETIQEKQFDIVTLPKNESFVLQGCAGSGKTMVLLHRLSYLMYNDESLTPRDVLVITPSRSFNSFIDELAQVLELERVSTITLRDYFTLVLKKAGLDAEDKFVDEKESAPYLAYVYSEKFLSDVKKTLSSVFDGIYGMFASEECRAYCAEVEENCRRQKEAYTRIRNASSRLRRAVLGEIKERPEGGVFYTRPFREFMNHVIGIEDFLSAGIAAKDRPPVDFYKQLRVFYRSAEYVVRRAAAVTQEAEKAVCDLRETVKGEIKDLRRYKLRVGGKEEYTYADRIAAREELIKEADKVVGDIRLIADCCGGFAEFFRVLQGNPHFTQIGKGEDETDTVRFFYKLTVKKAKKKHALNAKGLYQSDAYALLRVYDFLGKELYPHYNLVFVDEGQDISACEYDLLRKINAGAAFNVYGDLKQNVTPARGVASWEDAEPGATVYRLDQNYRNTNQIVDFVRGKIDVDMRPIGFDGAEVAFVGKRQVNAFFQGAKGLCAVIAKEEYLDDLARSSYHRAGKEGSVSKKKVNLLSVYESKGLEFGSVAVYPAGMSENEFYIACTRALNRLAIIGEKSK